MYQIVVPATQPSQDDTDVTDEVFLFERREVTPRLNERVIVRMVFEQKGHSIFEVRDCKELLQATRQWVEGTSDCGFMSSDRISGLEPRRLAGTAREKNPSLRHLKRKPPFRARCRFKGFHHRSWFSALHFRIGRRSNRRLQENQGTQSTGASPRHCKNELMPYH